MTTSLSGPIEIKLDDLTDVYKFSSAEPNIIYSLKRDCYGLPFEPSSTIVPPIVDDIFGEYTFLIGNFQEMDHTTSPVFFEGDTVFQLPGASNEIYELRCDIQWGLGLSFLFGAFLRFEKIIGTGTLTTPQADMISIDNNSLTLPASSIIGIADTRTGPLSFSVIASSDSGHLQINSSNLTIKQIA